MKTSKVTYCLLAALSSLAAAQEPAPEPRVKIASQGKAVIVTRGEDGKEEVKTFEYGGDGAEGGAVGGIAIGAAPVEGVQAGAVIGGAPGFAPAGQAFMKVRELAEPIRWTIGSDMFDALHRTGPVTFLGVSAIPVPRELTAHLPIAEDTGLGVEGVSPDSPAEKAGLQKSDVLMKLDDQILIHPRQLNVLVANHKEGESVKLTYLRKGEVKEVSVTLGKRDVPPADAQADVMFHSFGGDAPLRTFTRRFDVPGVAAEAQVHEVEKELRHAKENLQKQAEEMRKDADAKMVEAKKRIVDGKLQEEVRRAAEAAYSVEVQRAAEEEMRRAKAAAEAAEAETRKEIDELRQKLDAVLKHLEEKK